MVSITVVLSGVVRKAIANVHALASQKNFYPTFASASLQEIHVKKSRQTLVVAKLSVVTRSRRLLGA